MRRIRRWTVRSGATLVAAAVLLGGLPAPVSMSAAQAGALAEVASFEPPANGFDWSVPDRFGPDADGDGIVDYHWKPYGAEVGGDDWPQETYKPTWVHPSSFPVDFDGCPTAEEAERAATGRATTNEYVWTFAGQPSGRQQTCRLRHSFSEQGEYDVTLTIVGPDGSTVGSYTQEVYVRDLLIVSLGDSYASGEGNPDVAQQLRPDGVGVASPPRWVDDRCHRSASAGPAQAARTLEASDPKTSVTFLSFACSGATIRTKWGTNPFFPYLPFDEDDPSHPGTGVLGPYAGAAPAPGADKLPSQLDQLKAALQLPDGSRKFRPVDALVISAGGNDAGFAPIAAQCVLVIEECMGSVVHRTRASNTDLVSLVDRVALDLQGLTETYHALDGALEALSIPITRTYVTEYPDSTTDDSGTPCSAMLEDVLHPNLLAMESMATLLSLAFGPQVVTMLPVIALGLWTQTRAMTRTEVEWARNTVAPGINSRLRGAARELGWRYVGGISDRYVGHGYCAHDSYVRRAPESSQLQGPWKAAELAGVHTNTKGTLHPNVTGHRVYAEQLVPHLAAQFGIEQSASSFTFSEQVAGSTSRRGSAGWLTGRCPTGTSECTSDAAVASVDVVDPIGLKEARVFVNGRPGCAPEGVTCTVEPVGGDTQRFSFVFGAEGIWKLEVRTRNRRGQVGTFEREVKVDLSDPTATAFAESGRAPTGVGFEGHDGRGSGVDQIRVEGLSSGTAASTAPGLTVPVDLGGSYELRFRAVDEAGRTGPWQTQTLTVAGPTMAGTGAYTHHWCTQFWPEDTYAYNDGDGRAVMLSNDRHRATAVPARRALSARSKATWQKSTFFDGNEDCLSGAGFSEAPLNVRSGTSGLPSGAPVTLQATVHLGGMVSEHFDTSDPDFITHGQVDGYFTIAAPSGGSCGGQPCAGGESPMWIVFDVDRQTWGQDGIETSGYVDHFYQVGSNRETKRWGATFREHPPCVWPCSLSGPNGPDSTAPFRFPAPTLTITFESHVGARHLIEGALHAFTQAYSDARTEVSAEADVTAVLDLRPAAGFEGVELVHGDLPGFNRQPVAAPDTATTDEDNPVNVAVLANDGDADGDTLTVTAVSDPPRGTATLSPDGTITYTPDTDANGTDSISYTVDDGYGGSATGTVEVTINPVNDAPVATPDTATTDEDTPVSLPVLANDGDADGDTLTVTAVSDPPRGTATLSPDGTITYTPDAGHLGDDRFTYTVTDGAAVVAATVVVAARPRTISVEDARVVEGNIGVRPARFALRLSSPAPRDVTVRYATTQGSARALDYLTSVGIVTVPAGSLEAIVEVLVLGDRIDEADETFFLGLSTPVGVRLGRASAVGTIVDDD